MKLNRTDVNLDRTARNKENENWNTIEGSVRKMSDDFNNTTQKLEDDFNNVVESISDQVVEKLVDTSKLDWREPVDTIEDLPSADPIGTVRQVREATSDGVSMMYRKYEDGWKVVQEYDATAINEVDSRLSEQMSDTESQIQSIENANAKSKINLKNYLGNYQNIHPKVLYFEGGWNGHKYWMAYTPYPLGQTAHENPCIAYSDDMVNWYAPLSNVNPLDPQPSFGYNSDTHLVYRTDLNHIEVWWRAFDTSTSAAYYYRRISADGITWTPKELLWAASDRSEDIVSPAIIFEDNKYKLWGVHVVSREVVYMESVTAKNWTTPVVVPMDWTKVTPWHLDVIRTEKGLEFIICAYGPGGGTSKADLYYVLLKLNGETTKPRMILKRGNSPTDFDNVSIYRSSVLKKEGVYYIFYSAIAEDLTRSMSLSYGRDISGLNGFNVKKDVVINNDVRVGSESVENLDVSDISALYITGDATIKSLRGGYRNKRLSIVLFGSGASATFEHGDRITVPGSRDYRMEYRDRLIVDLVCTSDNGNYWRVASNVSGVPNEGDWSPRIEGAAFKSRQGSYVRIGRLVHAWFEVELSSKGTATTALIRDLPFGAKNTGTCMIADFSGVPNLGSAYLGGVVDKGGNTIRLRVLSGNSSSSLTPGMISDSFMIKGCAIYETP